MRALIVVDLQHDFLPGGALAVPGGDEVIPRAVALIEAAELAVATQDWHPADHLSFASQHPGRRPGELVELAGLTQVLWPDHCVMHSHGAALHPAIAAAPLAAVFRKGERREIDSYSGFFDNGRRAATGLADWLRARGVTQLDVIGLALDYCVAYTALDAVELGFSTRVRLGACRAVALGPDDVPRTLARLRASGVELVEPHVDS